MIPAYKRLILTAMILLILVAVVELFAYDVFKINWVTFMAVGPAAQAMEHPLPVPTAAVPVDGAAYSLAAGAPANPVPADAASLARGQELYNIHCALCHGAHGKGDGPVASHLNNKPYDLTSFPILSYSDGGIFFIISTGVPGKMPALNGNLTVPQRWDVVNYVRTLK